ncbi:flagellar biosynthesis protein FlhA [Paracoccaceae bacterium GXU_MW_L88]
MEKARHLFQPTILMALALMAVITMMILPMPAFILDMGLATSFALAILIFTITLFIERPLDFSSFPMILLSSLMLRLALNVSSTKLIIGEGHKGTRAAGEVINGFADFIMGGSLFLGLVVFGVLMIVNFIVITKGAGRMAEVGARFALDGMPGKQLAIDSDMAAGAINHDEARERRRIEQEETTFFGSLDGVSKFVKGDAVAGLLITLLNFVMGLSMGLFVHGMPVGQAFETYTILTVGDGLVTQIPAVIISIASAILLSKGGAVGSADQALIQQIGRYPTALATVAALLALFGLMPGLPFIPFIFGAGVLGASAWLARKKQLEAAKRAALPQKTEAAPQKETLGDILDLDEIHIEFAPDLVPVVMDEATGLNSRISTMRNHIAAHFGLVIPEIRITDNPSLPDKSYSIKIQSVEAARGALEPDQILVLLQDERPAPDGVSVAEPVYGAPARWIAPQQQEDAALAGLATITPTEVVATHLLETLKQNFGRLFNRRALRRLLDQFVTLSDGARADANKRIIDEFVPDRVPIDQLQAVMRLLLEERISIRNIPLILEAISEINAAVKAPAALCEHVRQRMAFQITAELTDKDGQLPLIQLAPEWEDLFQAHQIDGEAGAVDVALPPDEFNRLATSIGEKIQSAAAAGRYPAIVSSTRRRRFLHTVLVAKGIRNPVLSYEEIGPDTRPSLVGVA